MEKTSQKRFQFRLMNVYNEFDNHKTIKWMRVTKLET